MPLDDVREVSNYVAAMELGMQRLREGLPISGRLLNEMHATLLRTGRGARRSPGEFRRSQNWIGGTRPGNAACVPPPPHLVADCMSDLERFIHDRTIQLPLLVRAAFAHVQFESIHPYLDGNGRLGRLLITLMLHAEGALGEPIPSSSKRWPADDRMLHAAGALGEPILYLSLYFKTHRQTYYELLQRVRTEGDWEAWLAFFLDGVADTSRQAAATARATLQLFEADRKTIEALGRRAGSALQVH